MSVRITTDDKITSTPKELFLTGSGASTSQSTTRDSTTVTITTSGGSQSAGLVGPITVTFAEVVALTGEGAGYYVIPVYTLPANSMLRGAFVIAGDTPLDEASGATSLLAADGDDFYNAAQSFNGSAPTSGSIAANGWLNGQTSYTTTNAYTTEESRLAIGYWSDPDGPPTEGSALIWLDIAEASAP